MTLLPAFLIDPDAPLPDPFGLGQAAVDFISDLILENGEPFDLHPVQERILRKVFGDTDEDGERLIETLFLYVPSGQAKSTLAAAITLMMLAHPRFRIKKGQLVVAAATKEQAGQTTFGMVKGFLEREFEKPQYEDSPNALPERFRVIDNAVEKSIEHRASGSTLRVLSRTPDSQEGLSVYCLVAEEVHAWNRPRIWPVLRKSQAKVTASTPLTIVATTAGVGVGGIGHELYSQAKDIAAGKIENPSWLPIIYEAEPEDDWRDERVWHRCNFALGTFKSLRTLRNLAMEAATTPQGRREFERYHLNRWHEGVADPWIDLAIYDASGNDAEGNVLEYSDDDLKKLPAFIGVDGSTVDDLSIVSILFRDGRRLIVKPFAWVPAESVARRSEEDNAPYLEWSESEFEFITATEGASIDEDAIESKIRELADTYNVEMIGADPWHLQRMLTRLHDDGLPVVKIPQRTSHMSPAMKRTEKAILDGDLVHFAHPVLRWCFANIPAPTPDTNGNILPTRKHARKAKIDAAVATMIAVFLATIGEEDIPLDFTALTGLPPKEEAENG